jgi:ARC6-like, IMS domain
MLEEYPLIIRLENKIDELCRDRSITQKIVNSNSSLLTLNTAIEEYVVLKQDVIIPLGIRYLSLSCIASHYQLYQDNREISQLKDIIGQAINIPTHAEVFCTVQVIKSKYCHIYDCDRREFDRVERLTKEMSHASILSIGKEVKKSILFTDEEVKSIIREERTRIFRLLSVMISMLLVGGGIGISVGTRQQPQSVSTNIRQPSTQIPSPSNLAPVVITTPSPVTAVIPKPSPVPVITPEPQISQAEAISLIQKWLEAKKTLFAPPFDRESAASLMTGKAYTDKIKGLSSNGTQASASEWLEKNHYYRSYGLQRIDGIEKFEVSGSNAIIDVRMTEHSNLYNAKGQLQKLKSGLYSKIIRYILVKEDETIKISDYNDLKTSKRK